MATQEANFLRDRTYVAVSMTHFFVDILNNSRTLLVALLAISIGLTNAQVGIALLVYNVGSSLTQPLFGLLADRFGPRWPVVGGIGWMIILYSLAAVAGEWPALVAITLAGLGSGAFHPTGTKVASETSQLARTRATAVFFMSGQFGLFLGPILAGALLELFGRKGYLALPVLALVALASAWRWVWNEPASRHFEPISPAIESPVRRESRRRNVPWTTVVPLVTIIVSSSTTGIVIMNFAPKLFAEMGYGPTYVGWTAGLYMMGSALGGIAGGALGDRRGRRPPILIGMLGAMLPIYFYIPVGDPWRFMLLALAGFFAGMPHSVLVILAQSLLPGRRALASGLILGLMFFSGAVGSYFVGVLADRIGLSLALQVVFVLPLVAAMATWFLPRRRQDMITSAA